MGRKFLVLGSHIALGVYVPAIIIARFLKRKGQQVDFCYHEDLYIDEKKSGISKNKYQFHKNYRLAQVAHSMPSRNESAVDPKKKEGFIQKCVEQRYDSILLLSGFWVDLINELVQINHYYNGKVKYIHMDAVESNSWKNKELSLAENVWLFRKEGNQVNYVLDKAEAKDRNNRNGRIVIHGGGWGMGNYQSVIKELNEKGFQLDIVVYYKDEVDSTDTVNRYFLLDPDWEPDVATKSFPRLLSFEQNHWSVLEGEKESIDSPILNLIRNSQAIISKPGGGTLLDSLMTSTPIIFLEALADYEKKNMELWIEKGFGLDYKQWIGEEHQVNKIGQCIEALLKEREKLKIYGDELIV